MEATGTELSINVRDDYRPGERVTLGIRTERFALPGTQSALPARLYSGSWYEYELDRGGQRLHARHRVRVDGAELLLGMPEDGAYIFRGGLP